MMKAHHAQMLYEEESHPLYFFVTLICPAESRRLEKPREDACRVPHWGSHPCQPFDTPPRSRFCHPFLGPGGTLLALHPTTMHRHWTSSCLGCFWNRRFNLVTLWPCRSTNGTKEPWRKKSALHKFQPLSLTLPKSTATTMAIMKRLF